MDTTWLRFHSKPKQIMVAVALACGGVNCRVRRSGGITHSGFTEQPSVTVQTRGTQLDPVPIHIAVKMGPDCNQTLTSQRWRPEELLRRRETLHHSKPHAKNCSSAKGETVILQPRRC